MSNPGVLTLTEKHMSHKMSFRVEDNLAESIHFHYNDIRVDLTIAELNYIASVCDETIYDLVHADGFNLDDFDCDFLNSISQYLIDLENTRVVTVNAEKLYALEKNGLGVPVRKRITAAPKEETVSEYLPVIFNGSDTVMFGRERAAQALRRGEKEIPVLCMNYEKGKHTVRKNPWVDYLFKWDKNRLIKTAKKLAHRIIK